LSRSVETTFICSKCGKPSKIPIWENINVDLNPELKEKVVDGSLFLVSCPYCSFQQRVECPVLYHDQTRKYVVWWFPKDSNGKQNYTDEEINQFIPIISGYRLRIVATLNELREKIFIFDHTLDDRVIEILKFMVWKEYLETKGVKPNDIFFSNSPEGSDHQSIEFVYVTADGGPRWICAQGKNAYARALDILLKIKVPTKETFQWKVIDSSMWSLVQKETGQGVEVETEKHELHIP
jgi:hypothetical protein